MRTFVPRNNAPQPAAHRLGHSTEVKTFLRRERAAQRSMLKTSRPGDSSEQEADRVAEHVTRMSQPAATQQRARRYGGAPDMPCTIASRLGAGTALDAASRSYFEPRFGHDFGQVSIHSGPQAAAAAAAIQARAFTLGHDVAFAAGEYAPRSEAGTRLLAHELAHVVQQRESGNPLTVYRAVPTPQTAPSKLPFELVGNEAGAAGARSAAARLGELVTGPAVARALETIPITDPAQKSIVIQHILNSPEMLRRLADAGKVRSLSEEEYATGKEELGFPSLAAAFADSGNDFLYVTPHGTPSAYAMGHEVSHIQTGAVTGAGADPDLSIALGNLNTEVRAAFVDYAILKLAKLQNGLAQGQTDDQVVAAFAQEYASNVFEHIENHGSVTSALGKLAAVVSARRGQDTVPTNWAALKNAVTKGFVSEDDLAMVFSREISPIEAWSEPFEMEGH